MSEIENLEREIAEMQARLAELRAKEPDWIGAGIPDEAVEAGIAAWDKANHDLQNYVSGVTPDWDEGMICCAIYKAMAPHMPAPVTGASPQPDEVRDFAKMLLRLSDVMEQLEEREPAPRGQDEGE